jgi:hypothetical protein
MLVSPNAFDNAIRTSDCSRLATVAAETCTGVNPIKKSWIPSLFQEIGCKEARKISNCCKEIER